MKTNGMVVLTGNDKTAPKAPPDFLTDEAKTIWRETLPALSAGGVGFDPSIDDRALALFCSASADFLEARRELAGATGDARHKLFQLVYELIGPLLLDAMRDLGMTPASRAAIKANL
jgi:phage terminase small subunit